MPTASPSLPPWPCPPPLHRPQALTSPAITTTPEVASQSTLTRAQVKAQVQDAMSKGQLQPVGDAYLPLSQQQQSSDLSREQVRQETIAAGQAGLLDNYGE